MADLRPITQKSELEWSFAIVKELRPHLSYPEFMELYEAAKEQDGYTMIGAYEGDACVAVMGYRILHDFVHGKHLYVDDLVVTATKRSSGIGAELLKHAEFMAKEQGCKGLRLCTGIENERGRRFYERLGWAPRALAYKKSI